MRVELGLKTLAFSFISQIKTLSLQNSSYMRIKCPTRGVCLKSVTKCHKVSQSVTKCHKVSQSVTYYLNDSLPRREIRHRG